MIFLFFFSGFSFSLFLFPLLFWTFDFLFLYRRRRARLTLGASLRVRLKIKAQAVARVWETGHLLGTMYLCVPPVQIGRFHWKSTKHLHSTSKKYEKYDKEARPYWRRCCTDSPSCNSTEMHWMLCACSAVLIYLVLWWNSDILPRLFFSFTWRFV